MTCEQHQNHCEQRFNKIEKDLTLLTEEHYKLDGDVRVSNARLEQLTKTLAGLTKALWGVVISVFTLLAGFLIWYIQNHA